MNTITDDVRARFEEHHGITWGAIQSLPIGSGSRIYLESHYKRHFDTWQAAHADLAGEVRELVEAAEEMVGVYVAKYAMESGTTLGPLEFQFRALEAALAKFHPTHQEKP